MGLEALKRVVQLHQHSRGGFNGTILNGNFVVLDLDFWYQRQVGLVFVVGQPVCTPVLMHCVWRGTVYHTCVLASRGVNQ